MNGAHNTEKAHQRVGCGIGQPLRIIRARPAALATVKCAPVGIPDRIMLEINPLVQKLKDIEARTDVLRGYL